MESLARLCRPGRQASCPDPRGKAGFSTFKSGCGRETDCLLEGDGFELPVPEGKTGQTAQTTLHPILVWGPSSGVRPTRCRRDEIRTPRPPARMAGSVPSDLTP